jgi:hypothetical protein
MRSWDSLALVPLLIEEPTSAATAVGFDVVES